jgi:DNA-binding NtrC family response regulator
MTTEQYAGLPIVLVVDDDNLLRSALARMLKRRGFDSIPAESGDAALAILEEADRKIELVLADIVMPGMSGLTLAQRIGHRYLSTKTLFMSGFSFLTLQREYGMSADLLPYFLRKPFAAETLIAKLSELLEVEGRRLPS